MSPSDRSPRRDPSFDSPDPPRAGAGPRFTFEEEERRPRPRDDFRADPREGPVWRGRPNDEFYEEPAARPPYLIISTLAAVCAVAAVAWYFYNRGLDAGISGPPPLIRAESGPAKIAPDQPGGMIVPNQDKLVYNRVAGARSPDDSNGSEELMAGPEQPKVPPSGANSQAELMARVAAQNSGSAEISGDRAPKALPGAEEAAPPPVARKPGFLEAPKDAVAVKPTGDVAKILGLPDSDKPAQAEAPPPPKPASKNKVSPEIAAILSPQPASKASASTSASAPPGGIVIQVGALRDEGEAHREWSRLIKKYPSLLGSLSPAITEVEVGGRTLYRLRATGVADLEAARDICAKLKAHEEACLIP